MVARDSPVTHEELHAFTDGELPADRRAAVEAWLGSHPDDAELVAQWRAQADMLRARYAGVAEEPVPASLDIHKLARQPRRFAWPSFAAAVTLAFVAGGGLGWLAHGATDNAQSAFDVFNREALDAHRLYVVEVRHPVEVEGTERPHLVQWLSKRLGAALRAPDLASLNLTLVGGRLLPGPAGAPAAFLMYESPSGERFTLSCAKSRAPQTAMHYREASNFATFAWVEGGLAYVVAGPAERKRLWKVAQASYDQIDKAPQKQDGN